MYADYILESSAIFTSRSDTLIGGFVAVKGNTIAAVSENKNAIKQWKGPHTKTLSYNNKLILPGFCESHAHIFFGALELDSVNVVTSSSEKEAAKMIYDSEKNKDNEWVFGFGWNQHYWNPKQIPTKKSLDQYFPDKPVMIFNEELHSLWVNSKALEICNITKNTKIPAGRGKIAKDENGDPTGYLLEPIAMKFVLDKALRLGIEKEAAIIEKYFNLTSKLGITALSDMQIFDILKHEAYKQLEDKDKLKARIHIVASAKDTISDLLKLKKTYHSEKLCFSGAKEFIDGTAMGYTGLLIDDYSDLPGLKGEIYIDPASFREKAIAMDKAGIRIRLHACGDGAVRMALDIYEAASKANGLKDSRHTIEHIENIHPEDFPRFKKLGVIASVQPDHLWCQAFDEHPFHQILGEKRCKWTWPFKSLNNHGAILAFGSDNPIAELNPVKGIYRAVTRLAEDKNPKGGWNPQEKLTIAEAIQAYTIGSAYQMFREHDFGTLEAGKFADIVVLDRNLFAIDREEILETSPLLTMVDGKIIYQK